MLKTASQSIEESFKELLKEKPYKKITVSEICERSNVSRKTFYVSFCNKEAIVKSLFNEHVIRPMHSLHKLLSKEDVANMSDTFAVRMYESLYSEREYYTNLIKPIRGRDDTFIRVVTWEIYDFNLDHIPDCVYIPNEWTVDYVAYFFAASQAMFIQKWISEDMVIPPKDLAALYNQMTMPFWENLDRSKDFLKPSYK